MPTVLLPVDTPQGPGRFHLDAPAEPRALLVLGHGAGGGVTAADLELLSRRLPLAGVAVARFEQPWRVAGRRAATPPPKLDEAWLAAVSSLLALPPWAGLRLVLGGRSAGARVACRTAAALAADAVLCLAFPLHLPGRPERSRAAELLAPAVPRLVLQGTRDAFGSADEVRAVAAGAAGIRVVELPGADHGFRVAKGAAVGQAELRDLIAAEALGLATAGIPTG